MLRKLPRRVMVLVVLASSLLFITGCGDSVSGLYTDDSGTFKFDFKSDGKVSVTMIGETKEATYTVKDKTVVVTVPGTPESLSFAISDDGSLRAIGGPGITLKKK
jgi:hypothetical protein